MTPASDEIYPLACKLSLGARAAGGPKVLPDKVVARAGASPDPARRLAAGLDLARLLADWPAGRTPGSISLGSCCLLAAGGANEQQVALCVLHATPLTFGSAR